MTPLMPHLARNCLWDTQPLTTSGRILSTHCFSGCTEDMEKDQMVAVAMSLIKELSAPTIMYDKYCDGEVQGAMVYLVGSRGGP